MIEEKDLLEKVLHKSYSLELSCAEYHNNYGNITAEDIELANNIRSYYKGKLLKQRIIHGKLTPFRTSLEEFLCKEPEKTSDGLEIYSQDYTGMLHVLPYFYENDMKLEKLFKESKKVRGIENPIFKNHVIKFADNYSSHKSKKKEYCIWFVDHLDNKFLLRIPFENFLSTYFMNLVSRNITFAFSGSGYQRTLDDFEFIEIVHLEDLLLHHIDPV